MKVSVVIPVYNSASTLPSALESLRAQSIPELEIIVVNDGSSNGTLDLLHRQHDIMLLDHSRRCIAATLNDGLTAASGDYIACMDACDVCHPDRMELQASYLDVYSDIGVVGCRVGFRGSREEHAGHAAYVDWINKLIEPDEISLNCFLECPFIHSSVMFRRELFEQFGAYRDGPFPEDHELWLRWMANGVKCAKVDEELILWNDHPERLLQENLRCRVDAFYPIKAEYLAMWLTKNNPWHPDVIVWGNDLATHERAAILEQQGIRITKYIDLRAYSPNSGKQVIHHNNIPEPDSCFVLPLIGQRGAREKIRAFLNRRGFVEGRHCIFSI